MINTLTGIAVDVNKRKMVLATTRAALPGLVERPVALRMVWQSAKKVHIPIIGMGGIETGEDAAAFMLCGAKAVMVGTANFTDPFACPRIIRELDGYCDRQKAARAGAGRNAGGILILILINGAYPRTIFSLLTLPRSVQRTSSTPHFTWLRQNKNLMRSVKHFNCELV